MPETMNHLQSAAPLGPSTVLRDQTQARMVRLCREAVSAMKLDLSGMTVLTEAATGPFAVTPLIAALADAERVVAVTRDSRYGSAGDSVNQVKSLLTASETAGTVEFHVGGASQVAAGCNLVTNLGFVRPLDRALLSRLPNYAVVSLMWEPWEFRESDIDLAAMDEFDLSLVATNEHHPLVETFRFLGPTVARLALETGIELVNARLLLIGSDPFGCSIADWLTGAGATVTRSGLETWTDCTREEKCFDAVILAEHVDSRPMRASGADGDAAWRSLAQAGTPIIRVCGMLDAVAARANNVAVYPEQKPIHGVMSVTTAYAGPKPVVDLHCAGLRAGADVVRGRLAGLSRSESIAIACQNGFGLDVAR